MDLFRFYSCHNNEIERAGYKMVEKDGAGDGWSDPIISHVKLVEMRTNGAVNVGVPA